jgi:hypothetical protein
MKTLSLPTLGQKLKTQNVNPSKFATQLHTKQLENKKTTVALWDVSSETSLRLKFNQKVDQKVIVDLSRRHFLGRTEDCRVTVQDLGYETLGKQMMDLTFTVYAKLIPKRYQEGGGYFKEMTTLAHKESIEEIRVMVQKLVYEHEDIVRAVRAVTDQAHKRKLATVANALAQLMVVLRGMIIYDPYGIFDFDMTICLWESGVVYRELTIEQAVKVYRDDRVPVAVRDAIGDDPAFSAAFREWVRS